MWSDHGHRWSIATSAFIVTQSHVTSRLEGGAGTDHMGDGIALS